MSFGLVRKWNTEKEFKERVADHSSEFVERVVKWVEATRREYRDFTKLNALSLEELASSTVVPQSQADRLGAAFSDAALYGDLLVRKIEARLFPTGKLRHTDTIIKSVTFKLDRDVEQWVIDSLNEPRAKKTPLFEGMDRYWMIQPLCAIKASIDLLKKPKLSRADQRDALFYALVANELIETRAQRLEKQTNLPARASGRTKRGANSKRNS